VHRTRFIISFAFPRVSAPVVVVGDVVVARLPEHPSIRATVN